MHQRLALFIVSLFMLAGCASPVAPQPESQVSTAPASDAAESSAAPESSAASLTTDAPSQASTAPASPAAVTSATGRIISKETGEPMADTIVRLAEVYQDDNNQNAAFALDEAQSPGAYTDAQGNFTIENIPARDYVLVVGDVYGAYAIVPDDSGKPKVWSASADEPLNIGEISIELIAAPSPSS